jgi:hypothetical protein
VARITSSRNSFAVALAVLLAACATAEKMEEARDSWQGASYEEVLRAWGAPARSTKTPDGREWHTWVTESYPQPTSSFGIGVGGASVGRGGGTSVGVGMGVPIGTPPPPERCERTLIVVDGKVAESHWNGPPSMCVDFKRK